LKPTMFAEIEDSLRFAVQTACRKLNLESGWKVESERTGFSMVTTRLIDGTDALVVILHSFESDVSA
jgi:hypothetical protein